MSGGLGNNPRPIAAPWATAVVAVAHRTIAGKVLQPGFKLPRGCPDRVRSRLDLTRDGEPTDGPRHARLHRPRLRLRFESRAHHIGAPSGPHGGYDEKNSDNDQYQCPHVSPAVVRNNTVRANPHDQMLRFVRASGGAWGWC